MSNYSTKALKRKFYGAGYRSPFDRFNDLARRLAKEDFVVLHAGCGSDSSVGFRGQARLTLGLDYNAWVRQNQDLDLALIGDVTHLPIKGECADLIAARWLMEHLIHPEFFFVEAARLLRRGGRLLLLTPNLWNYATLITRLSPDWFQQWFVEKALHANPEGVFTTYYRANTPQRLRRLAGQAGLIVESMELIEGAPNLLSFSPLTFILGVAYERLVSHIEWLSGLRGAILVVLRKG